MYGVYQMTECLSARVGYQAMWLESIAVAADQGPSTSFAQGNGINMGGGAFFQGAFAGLQYVR